MPRRILETMCLAEWVKAFEIKKHADTPKLNFKTRFRVHVKIGFRSSVRTRGRRDKPS